GLLLCRQRQRQRLVGRRLSAARRPFQLPRRGHRLGEIQLGCRFDGAEGIRSRFKAFVHRYLANGPEEAEAIGAGHRRNPIVGVAARGAEDGTQRHDLGDAAFDVRDLNLQRFLQPLYRDGCVPFALADSQLYPVLLALIRWLDGEADDEHVWADWSLLVSERRARAKEQDK